MAAFSGVECDLCGKVERLGNDLDPPTEWITLKIYKTGARDVTVCGTKCAGKWVKEKAAAEKIPPPDPNAYCKRMCKASNGGTGHDINCPLAASPDRWGNTAA